MFITVTRRVGGRALRLAVPAIAYLDRLDEGSAVRLIGGETLMVSETVDEIEERALPPLLMIDEPLGVVEEVKGVVDEVKELAAIDAAAAIGAMSGEAAVDARIDVVKRRGSGRR